MTAITKLEPRSDDDINQSLDALEAGYGESPLVKAIGSISVVSASTSFAETVMAHGMFPSRQIQFCTEDLKGDSIAAWFSMLEDDAVNAVGVRAAESTNRADLPEWEWSEKIDAEVWRPILRWSAAEVMAMLRSHGAQPNHLYFTGAGRVGCWPCKNLQGAQLLQWAATATEWTMNNLRVLERVVGAEARKRYDRRLATFSDKGIDGLAARDRQALIGPDGKVKRFYLPVLFQLSNTPSPMPLDEALAYTRARPMARRRAQQAEMFDPGCTRWGLCEAEGDDE